MDIKVIIGCIVAFVLGIIALVFYSSSEKAKQKEAVAGEGQPLVQPAPSTTAPPSPTSNVDTVIRIVTTGNGEPTGEYLPPVKNPVQEGIEKLLGILPEPERTLTDEMTSLLLKANAKRTYNIKLDLASQGKFNANSGPMHDPEVNDLDGFSNTGAGEGIMINGVVTKGVTYNGKTYSSFLHYTKSEFGAKDPIGDPLGIKGWIAWMKATSRTNEDPYWVNYEWHQSIGVASQPGEAPQLNEWQTAYQKLDCNGIQAEINALIQGGIYNAERAARKDYLVMLQKSKCSTPERQILTGGGTLINAPDIPQICELGTDGNMHCRPK